MKAASENKNQTYDTTLNQKKHCKGNCANCQCKGKKNVTTDSVKK